MTTEIDAEGMAYEFDRYINGVLMAEGVTIKREPTLEKAMIAAARIASRGPNGEVPVLIRRITTRTSEAEPVAMMVAPWGEADSVSWLEGCEKLQVGDYLYAAPLPTAASDGQVEAVTELTDATYQLMTEWPEDSLPSHPTTVRVAKALNAVRKGLEAMGSTKP